MPWPATCSAGVTPAGAGVLIARPAAHPASTVLPGSEAERRPDLSTFLSPEQPQCMEIRTGPLVGDGSNRAEATP